MHENRFLISAITSCKNAEKYLKECLDSLINQSYDNREIIIVDGASTDNTVNILKSYSDKIIWISEPDKHAGEGFNKALKMAKGDIIYWINADDVAEPNAFKEAVDFFINDNRIEILYGNQYFIDENSNRIDKFFSHDFTIKDQIMGNFICVGSVFIKNELLKKYNYEFDESLTVNQDIDTWLFFTNRAKFKYVNTFWSSFRKHSNSGTYNEKYLDKRIQSTLISYKKFLEREDINRNYKRMMIRQMNKLESSMRFEFYYGIYDFRKALNIGIDYFRLNPFRIFKRPKFFKKVISLYFSIRFT